jgi:hypothetical protein
VNALIQSIGIGGLKPNTLLLSWPTREPGQNEATDSEYHTFTGMCCVITLISTDHFLITDQSKWPNDQNSFLFADKLLAGAVSGMALVVAKGITEFPSNVKLSGHLDVYWIVRDGGLCLLIRWGFLEKLLIDHRFFVTLIDRSLD